MTTLIESPHFILEHDPDCACLYATWQGHHDALHTHAHYEAILHFVSNTRSRKLLNDGLLDQNGWKELSNWIACACFHQLSCEGLVAAAWVLPRDRQALYDTRVLLNSINRPLIETFWDAEAAYKWLHQWPMRTNNTSALAPL
jgi:hypothetical protein